MATPTTASATPTHVTNSPGRPGGCPGAGSAAIGVFRETRPKEVDAYEKWLGCHVDLVLDYSSRDSWAEIASPRYLLDTWKDEPRRLVLSVAMLPEKDDRASLAKGAAGQYDTYFRQLGELLVASGQEDAILRVGWEFNISTARWFTTDPATFIDYWRRIVKVMQEVKGNRFRFDWNSHVGVRRADATLYYPGDDVVDFVGIDVYDVDVTRTYYPYGDNCDQRCRTQRQTAAWDESIFGGDRGLSFWRGFARQHDKPLSLPEWGMWRRSDGIGGGDDPAFIQRMHAFIVDPQSRIAYQAYFEFDSPGSDHRLMTTFQRTGTVYRQLLSGRRLG